MYNIFVYKYTTVAMARGGGNGARVVQSSVAQMRNKEGGVVTRRQNPDGRGRELVAAL